MVKQGTKGQKEIYEANRSTIIIFGIACSVVIGIHLIACFFFISCNYNSYIFFWITVMIELVFLAIMKSMAGARFDERGKLTDAGMDLNDPTALGEYCKDVIIIALFSQITALYSSYAYLILLVVPAAAAYKIVVSFLIPWITAPAADDQDESDKKSKKRERREKIIYRR